MIVQIQCTAKLLKKLTHNEYNPATSLNALGVWHANLLRFNRKECVLFTHDATLYSIFIPKTNKQFYKNLGPIFLENLIRNLESENLQKYVGFFLREYSPIQFVKSSNRSVLGTMNNMAITIDYFVYQDGELEHTDIIELNRHINRTLFTAIKYQYPIECFQDFLLKHFESH